MQLLLLEKGSAPEMFRLEFKNKKEAKAYVTHSHTISLYVSFRMSLKVGLIMALAAE